LLQQAKTALTKSNLAIPPKQNAFELYQRVLKLDPENIVAVDGVAQVKIKLLQKISLELSNNNLEKTKFWLDQADTISFSTRRLKKLKKEYKNKLTVKTRISEITAAVDSNQLDLAYQILEETYFLDPSNKKLRKLRSTIESKLRSR